MSSLRIYHKGRNHQGLDNQIIEPGDEVGVIAGKVECRERLGGMLKYYCRDAAESFRVIFFRKHGATGTRWLQIQAVSVSGARRLGVGIEGISAEIRLASRS